MSRDATMLLTGFRQQPNNGEPDFYTKTLHLFQWHLFLTTGDKFEKENKE